MTKPLSERLSVVGQSASTTQHSLVILLDGVPVATLDNSRPGVFRPNQPTDFTCWRLHDPKDVQDEIKLWYVQRYMKFSSESGMSDEQFMYEYDAYRATIFARDADDADRVETDRQRG